MKLHKSHVILIILLLFSNSLVFSQNTITNTKVEKGLKCNSAENAEQLALRYTGFDKMPGFSVKSNVKLVDLITINNDKTPFLNEKINNNEIWQVTLENVDIRLLDNPEKPNKYIKKFNIWIDPASGKLLKIFSKYEGQNVDFLPEPSVEWAEKGLRDYGEIHLDFVNFNDYKSFYDILNSPFPPEVKEISAQLLLISRNNRDPQVVWSVTVRGIPPLTSKGKGGDKVPIQYLNYTRIVYDASSGRRMYWTSIPTVEPLDSSEASNVNK